MVLFLTLSTFEIFAQQPPPSAPKSASAQQLNGGGPIQLGQLREMLDALGVQQMAADSAPGEIKREQKQFPSWWPSSILSEMVTQAAQVDQAPIDLPFYQQCYSQEDGRFLTDLFRTPEGKAYGRHALGYVLQQQEEGQSPTDARSTAMQTQPGLNATVLNQLDARDQRHARELFGTHRGTALKLCLGDNLPKAIAAVQAAQLSVQKSVVDTHRSEIDSAKARYDADHSPATTKP